MTGQQVTLEPCGAVGTLGHTCTLPKGHPGPLHEEHRPGRAKVGWTLRSCREPEPVTEEVLPLCCDEFQGRTCVLGEHHQGVHQDKHGVWWDNLDHATLVDEAYTTLRIAHVKAERARIAGWLDACADAPQSLDDDRDRFKRDTLRTLARQIRENDLD